MQSSNEYFAKLLKILWLILYPSSPITTAHRLSLLQRSPFKRWGMGEGKGLGEGGRDARRGVVTRAILATELLALVVVSFKRGVGAMTIVQYLVLNSGVISSFSSSTIISSQF